MNEVMTSPLTLQDNQWIEPGHTQRIKCNIVLPQCLPYHPTGHPLLH